MGKATVDHRLRDSSGGPNLLQAFCVLAYASEVGPDVQALEARTGVPADIIRQIADQMRSAGLWGEDTIDTTDWFDEVGELKAHAFWGQAHLAIGRAQRVINDRGNIEYVICRPGDVTEQPGGGK